MKAKTFDCVELKRQGAKPINERLERMMIEEQVAYWRQRSEAFRREQEHLTDDEPRPSQPGKDS